MRNTRMATHSTSSFDESEEVRILSGFLESKRTIKTFFKDFSYTFFIMASAAAHRVASQAAAASGVSPMAVM